MIYKKNKIKEHLDSYFSDIESNEENLIHTRGKNRGGVLRLIISKDLSVIVKLWRIRSFKERVKSILRINNGNREWRMHKQIFRHGVQSPHPISYYRLTTEKGEHWEAMAIQDLGSVEKGLAYLKLLISNGDEDAVSLFEDKIIGLTRNLIDVKYVDMDNQLNNFVVDSSHDIYRIDFECAKKYRNTKKNKRIYINMISRLITSHVYAVQPEIDRSENFIKRLYACIDISLEEKKEIAVLVNKNLETQFHEIGIDSRFTLPDG